MEESNLPRNEYHQYLYPRLRGYSQGEDGEVTVHLSLGLPCCGLDLLVEHSPTMTALELYQIAGEFLAMRQRVRQLPSFNACAIPAGEKGNEGNSRIVVDGNASTG
jgi:hypothetical protein